MKFLQNKYDKKSGMNERKNIKIPDCLSNY